MERLRIAQRHRRRALNGFIVGVVALRRPRLRSKRDLFPDAIEYRLAMTATHLAFAHCELLRRHAEDSVTAGTARVFFLGHLHWVERASGGKRLPPHTSQRDPTILPRLPEVHDKPRRIGRGDLRLLVGENPRQYDPSARARARRAPVPAGSADSRVCWRRRHQMCQRQCVRERGVAATPFAAFARGVDRVDIDAGA
jgi:hypothetical protein